MVIFATNQSFDFGEIFLTKGGHYGPLIGTHLHALALLEGHDIIIADNKRYEISAGEECVFNTEHSIKFNHTTEIPTHLMWCCTGEFIPPIEMTDGFKEIQYSLSKNDTVKNLISLGVEIVHDENSHSIPKKDMLGQLVFDAIFYFINKENEEKPIPTQVLLAKKYIENTYTDDCDLKELADSIGWHPTYLLTNFKQNTGYTPTQYLWLLRAEKAVYLLNNTGMSVSEIAYQCKFNTPEHFTKHLKRHYGYTPTDLRKNWRYKDVRTYLEDTKEILYGQKKTTAL